MAFFCAGSSGEAKKKNAKPGMEHLHSELCIPCSNVVHGVCASIIVCMVCVCFAIVVNGDKGVGSPVEWLSLCFLSIVSLLLG